MAEVYYVGVDVGTASVRAALVSRGGLLESTAEEPISIWEPHTDHHVQSSTEIWEKCCTVVKVGRELRAEMNPFNQMGSFQSNLKWRNASYKWILLN